MSNTILLVEDDALLSTIISKKLEAKGHAVVKVYKGDAVMRQVIHHSPCAIIFDIDLPNMSGDQAYKNIKHFYNGIVLFYSAAQTSDVELKCLKLGADDFVEKNKPFDVFYQRLSRLLEKRKDDKSPPIHNKIGAFSFDKSKFICSYGDNNIELSSEDADLLSYMLINKDRLLTRESIYSTVKGYPYDGKSRSVDISISRLKVKLNSAGISKDIISSVRGKGYMFKSILLEDIT